jgi:hypothetical protein
MSWFTDLFPVQSRESEIEHTVHNCVDHIINSHHEFNIHEQMRIAHRVQETVEKSLQEEHMALMDEIRDYESLLFHGE